MEAVNTNNFRDIEEVVKTRNTDQCNDLLKKGWDLLSVSSGMEEGYLTAFYVLGLPRLRGKG